jgi:hypothetical protein
VNRVIAISRNSDIERRYTGVLTKRDVLISHLGDNSSKKTILNRNVRLRKHTTSNEPCCASSAPVGDSKNGSEDDGSGDADPDGCRPSPPTSNTSCSRGRSSHSAYFLPHLPCPFQLRWRFRAQVDFFRARRKSPTPPIQTLVLVLAVLTLAGFLASIGYEWHLIVEMPSIFKLNLSARPG